MKVDTDILAQQVVEFIIDDLSDRRGLGQAWHEIDKDIKQEIEESWKVIIKTALQFIS